MAREAGVARIGPGEGGLQQALPIQVQRDRIGQEQAAAAFGKAGADQEVAVAVHEADRQALAGAPQVGHDRPFEAVFGVEQVVEIGRAHV